MDTRPPSSMRASSRLGSSSTTRSEGRSKHAFTEDMLMEYIPDLDEVQEQDIQSQVAEAPEYTIQQMTSLKELDADLLQAKPFSTVDGVNLRKLCKFLVPERFLVEHDEIWNWSNIYTEIASEIRKSFTTTTTDSGAGKKPEVPIMEPPSSSWDSGDADFRLNSIINRQPEMEKKFMGNALRD